MFFVLERNSVSSNVHGGKLKSHHGGRMWQGHLPNAQPPPVQSFPSPTPLLRNRWKNRPHSAKRPQYDPAREACHRYTLRVGIKQRIDGLVHYPCQIWPNRESSNVLFPNFHRVSMSFGTPFRPFDHVFNIFKRCRELEA